MGTRIEPTINHHPGDELTTDDNVHVPPDAGDLGIAASHEDADAHTDPTLAELAALESEVDNWLHPPAKAEPVAMEAEPAPAEAHVEPATPDTPPPPAPGRKRPAPWWALGAAALAVIAGAAVLLDKPAAPRQALKPVAASTPAALPAPVQAAITPVPPVPAPRPEMVFLEQPPAAGANAAEPQAKPAEAEPAVKHQQRDTADTAVAAVKAPVKVKKTVAPRKAKPVKKTAPAPELAQRTQTWPPDRRASDAQRVEAARAACRARSRDPGACHIRVCDVLGSSHPACRE